MISLLLVSTFHANAQQTPTQRLSLKQAIEIATQRNGNLKTTQLEIGGQRALLPSAFDLPKTALDAQLGQTQARPVDYTLTAIQGFSPFSVYRAQENLIKGQISLTEKRYGLERNELITSVKQQYYQVLYLHQLLSLLRSQDTLYLNALKAAQVRYQTGETNRLEEVSASTRSQQHRHRQATTERDLQVSYRTLERLLFMREALQVDTTSSLIRSLPTILSDSLREQNPLLDLLRQQGQTLRLQTDVARQQLKPDWRVGIANQSIEKRVGYTYVMAGVGIPLFTKAQKARIEASKINEQIADNQLQNTSFQLENQLITLKLDLEKFNTSLRYYQQSALPQTDLLLKTTWRNFKEGEIDYVEFFQNVSQATQIREEYLRTQLEYSLTVIQVERLLGIE